MTTRSGWLGYDPAPGDPAALRELGRAAGRTAGALVGAAAELRGLAGDDSGWRGPAAQACRERLGGLPAQLDEAAGGLRAAHHALEAFADRLEEAQRRAWRLAREAEALRARPDDVQARALLERLRWHAGALHDEVLGDSISAERALRAAADLAPDEPGWFERFVRSNATLVEGASVVLGVAAGVAAASGVGLWVAPALAGMSLAATLALRHYGEADETAVLVAVAGAMTAGVGTAAVAAGRSAAAVAGGAAAAGGVPARAGAAATVGRLADEGGWAATAWSAGSFTGTAAGDVRAWQRRRACRTTTTVAPARPVAGPAAVAPLLDGPPAETVLAPGSAPDPSWPLAGLPRPLVLAPERPAGPVVVPAP